MYTTAPGDKIKDSGAIELPTRDAARSVDLRRSGNGEVNAFC